MTYDWHRIRDEPLGSYVRRLGPTWIIGAIAAGPATMVTVVTAGASFGYALLWVVIIAAIFGAIAQYLSMRVGLLTGTGLVTAVEEHIGERWAWLLVIDLVLAAGLAQLIIMKTAADVSELITGVDARLWGVIWAVLLAVGLGYGGYRFLETLAKVLVAGVVIAFIASLTIIDIDLGSATTGLTPTIPAGVDGALIAAAVLGGALHVTLVTMQSYNMRARGWSRDDYGLATFDVFTSMVLAFGAYSLAIFLVAAAVLHDPAEGIVQLNAVSAAEALQPALGEIGHWIFIFGLLGAAISTLGGNTFVPPYVIADKLDIKRDVGDPRYRLLVVAVALISATGVFIEGAFFQLLVFVLAFGLVGTPFALALVLYLANDPSAVDETASPLATIAGIVLLGVASVLAAEFVLDQQPFTGVLDWFVLTFAVVFGLATVALVIRFFRHR